MAGIKIKVPWQLKLVFGILIVAALAIGVYRLQEGKRKSAQIPRYNTPAVTDTTADSSRVAPKPAPTSGDTIPTSTQASLGDTTKLSPVTQTLPTKKRVYSVDTVTEGLFGVDCGAYTGIGSAWLRQSNLKTSAGHSNALVVVLGDSLHVVVGNSFRPRAQRIFEKLRDYGWKNFRVIQYLNVKSTWIE